MDSKINETTAKSRRFRRLIDKDVENWDRICWNRLVIHDDFQERIKNIHIKPYNKEELVI